MGSTRTKRMDADEDALRQLPNNIRALKERLEDEFDNVKHREADIENEIKSKVRRLLTAASTAKRLNSAAAKALANQKFEEIYTEVITFAKSLQGYGAPYKEWYVAGGLMLALAVAAFMIVFPPVGLIAVTSAAGITIAATGGISLAAAVGTFFANSRSGPSQVLVEIAEETHDAVLTPGY